MTRKLKQYMVHFHDRDERYMDYEVVKAFNKKGAFQHVKLMLPKSQVTRLSYVDRYDGPSR